MEPRLDRGTSRKGFQRMLLERLSPFGGLAPHLPGRDDDALQLALPPAADSPARARLAVREACRRWGVAGLTDAASLAVSELVTNAVVHAGTPLVVMADHDEANLTVAVADGDPRLPRLWPPNEEGESGRGMAIIDRLGATWGVQRTVLGKTVWISFAR